MARLLFSLVAAFLITLTGCDPGPSNNARTAERAAPAGQVPMDGFRDIVEAALPSIVFIQAEATPPPELEQFIPDLPEGPIPMGMGSGVIYRADGYILTNNHVVRDAERVLVVLHDRRFFEAEVIGRDPGTEVAVVRIRSNDLSVARVGDSDGLGIGDWVLAMGSPLGLEFSVTAGIVSGMGRAIGIVGTGGDGGAAGSPPLEHFIQTDAALSPGNSGGPLMNRAGEVIGINTAVAGSRGATPFGFAIPSNLAARVADQLIEHGRVRRPFIGVELRDVTPSLAEEHGLSTVEGAAVGRVQAGSPAEQAGLRTDDIILGLGDVRTVTVSDLQALLIQAEPGDMVELRVHRDGREATVAIELGELP